MEFLAASTDLSWDDTSWTDYMTQLDEWKLGPAVLTFTDDGTTTIT